MLDKITIEGEKNKELKLKVNELVETVNYLQTVILDMSTHIAPPYPTPSHPLNGLIDSHRFTVQTSQETSLRHIEIEPEEEPVGTVEENYRPGYVRVKRNRGWDVLKEEDYLKELDR